MNNLTEILEKYFSLHDVDMIYNVLQEFRNIDTKQGEITFEDFLNNKQKEIENGKNEKSLTRLAWIIWI